MHSFWNVWNSTRMSACCGTASRAEAHCSSGWSASTVATGHASRSMLRVLSVIEPTEDEDCPMSPAALLLVAADAQGDAQEGEPDAVDVAGVEAADEVGERGRGHERASCAKPGASAHRPARLVGTPPPRSRAGGHEPGVGCRD